LFYRLLFQLFIYFVAHASLAAATNSSPPVASGHIWKFSWQTDFFSSNQNYQNNKTEYLELANGGKLSTANSRISLQTPWLKNGLNLYAGANIDYAKSTLANVDRENSTVSEVFLGFKFWFDTKKTKMVSNVELVASLNKINENSDDVISSEGVHHLNLGTWIFREFGIFKPFAYLGVDLLSEGRAWFYDLKFGNEFFFNPLYFNLAARLSETIKDDDEINQSANRFAPIDRVNGGSFKYYSINPMELAAEATFGYRTHDFIDISLSYSSQLQGLRTAKGDTVSLAIRIEFGDDLVTQNVIDRRQKSNSRSKKKVKSFRPALDEDEQKLLEDDE